MVDGPYDVSLVEGSVTTERDARRIIQIRAASRLLVCIGACATSGGIQALRNFADVAEFTSVVYAHPQYISTLATSPVSNHVTVDFELRGCPIDKRQLLELLTALLASREPQIPAHSVCYECKLRGTSCVMVAHGTPCLGPITPASCAGRLPRLRPRLLRLFRPGGLAEPHRSGRAAAAARHDRGRRGRRVLSTFNAASPALASARRSTYEVRSMEGSVRSPGSGEVVEEQLPAGLRGGAAGADGLLRQHRAAPVAAADSPACGPGRDAAALRRRHLGAGVPGDAGGPGQDAGPVRAGGGVPAAGGARPRARPVPPGELLLPAVRRLPGLVSKLWLADDERGRYRGLYEWDGPEGSAENYARALWRVLALVSVRGSIHYVVLPGLRRDELLEQPPVDEADVAAWWRLAGVT